MGSSNPYQKAERIRLAFVPAEEREFMFNKSWRFGRSRKLVQLYVRGIIRIGEMDRSEDSLGKKELLVFSALDQRLCVSRLALLIRSREDERPTCEKLHRVEFFPLGGKNSQV